MKCNLAGCEKEKLAKIFNNNIFCLWDDSDTLYLHTATQSSLTILVQPPVSPDSIFFLMS